MAIRQPIPESHQVNWLQVREVRWCLREGCDRRETRTIDCPVRGCARECRGHKVLDEHDISVCLDYGLMHITNYPSPGLSVAFEVSDEELELTADDLQKALALAAKRVQAGDVA